MKKSSDIEHLESVKSMTAKENVFALNKKTFTSLEGIIAEIKKNEENLYIQNAKQSKISGKEMVRKIKRH